jgi:hypothetical protein
MAHSGSREPGAGSRAARGTTAGRGAEHPAPGSRLPILTALATLLACPLAAQVGYDPEHSPFRDIRKGSALALSVGYFAGDAGRVGIGATDGPTASGRVELSLGGPTMILLGASYMQLERIVVDPDPDTLPPRSGPFGVDVLGLDAALQIRLTGQKSYRRIAPYLGAAIGVAFQLSGPPDPGGYTFGTKFTVAPGAGIRIYPGRHLSLTADFRVLFWRESYPSSYQASPGGGDPILPLGASTTDWTTHPWTSVGVAWTF